jgi:hypothetical protein
MRNDLPARLIELWHVDGLSSSDLTLHLHLMQNTFLEEALGLNNFLFDGGILDELLPDLIRGKSASLV